MSMSETRHYDSMDTGPEWGTPGWVWKPIENVLGGFNLDPASGAESEPIAENRYTIEDNGLEKEWFGNVWINPPYGRSHNPEWAEKVSEEVRNTDTIVALIPASTSTEWWQNNYATADIHCWIDTRISFEGSGDNTASFSSVLCVFTESYTGDLVEELEKLGTVTYTND